MQSISQIGNITLDPKTPFFILGPCDDVEVLRPELLKLLLSELKDVALLEQHIHALGVPLAALIADFHEGVLSLSSCPSAGEILGVGGPFGGLIDFTLGGFMRFASVIA